MYLKCSDVLFNSTLKNCICLNVYRIFFPNSYYCLKCFYNIIFHSNKLILQIILILLLNPRINITIAIYNASTVKMYATKLKYFRILWKYILAYYSTGVVVAFSQVVVLAPGCVCETKLLMYTSFLNYLSNRFKVSGCVCGKKLLM
jgi:hypothetical protein